MINLVELAPKQAQLDAHIIQKRGLEGQDLLLNTMFALQVEVAELANEVRFFKHWSTDQSPRIKTHKDMGLEWKEYNPTLEEYVDCIHFLLSVGNQLGVDWKLIEVPNTPMLEIPRAFGLLMLNVSSMWGAADAYSLSRSIRMKIKAIEYLEKAADLLTEIGLLLGFTEEDITAAYNAKHKVNYERQANGY
ncbi:Dimeric dUTPase, all-alpha-NTP-PPase (MazG) superfamily [Terribacillus aidingensis]|uniref:Dimeric dUTPase, all-alpha-NTP-PPase (MazG) superfamily n=1 Tax=Terribacillus aidingensis TaxID=586416 RepID=A0A285NYF1_9BACI|nr:dUTP diphosphatase [Terribacillus aidingensis]SNZ14514.1 Dimeric dUTPase, all-alpha-NTP-PPase (MazG) superfamily [Terribacillus aidingensis]